MDSLRDPAGHRDGRLSRRTFLHLAGVGALATACGPSTGGAPAAPAKPATGAPGGASAPAATAAPAASTPAKLQIRVGGVQRFVSMINYEFGKQQGIFDREGIDVEVIETNGDATLVQGAQAGEWDLADGGAGAPIAAVGRGGTLRLLGGQLVRTPYAMYATSAVRGVEDLKGKHVGIAAVGSAPHVATVGWLKVYGMAAEDVQFVSLGPTPEVFRAVVAGKVDAGVAGIDFLPLGRRQGLTVLSDKIVDELPNFIVLAFYTRAQTLGDATKREAISRFFTAMANTTRAIYEPANKQAWIDVGVKLQERQADDLAFFWDWMREKRLWAANLELGRDQLQSVQELNVLVGSQDRVLPYDDVVNLELQRSVVEKLGEYRYS
jgi:NitT/TauT family transport system substrate-binding protein